MNKESTMKALSGSGKPSTRAFPRLLSQAVSTGLAVAVAGSFAAGTASKAGVLFQDTFDVAAQTTDLNANQAARQAGGSVTATYSTTLTGGNNYLAQIFPGPPSVLGVGNDGGATSYVYPNYDFTASHAAGGYFYIALDMNPTLISNDGAPDDTVWGSVRFGQDSNQNFVNAAAAGVGFLLRRNHGWQAFNGATEIGSGAVAPLATHHVVFRITDATDHNPFDGSQDITIQAYADGGATPILTYTRTSFAHNRVTFGQTSAHGKYYFSGIDNLEIGTAAAAQTPPVAPTGLGAIAMSHVRIALSWTDASADEDGFKIERADDAGDGNPNPATWTQIATPAANATSYSDSGLLPSTPYHYRVRASNAAGASDWAGPVNATTAAPPPPPATPSDLRATALSSVQINLAWTDNSSDETAFKIERAPDVAGSPGSWAQMAVAAANATNYLSTGLTPATAYHYRVRASNALADSEPSNEAGATTAAGPANDFTWTGVQDTGWTTLNNWLRDGTVPTQYPGNNGGNSQDNGVYFGGRNAGANNPVLSANRRVDRLVFQDAWDFNVGGRELELGGNWITAEMPGKDGAARIHNANNLQFWNPMNFVAQAGDTLVCEVYMRPRGSNNRTYTFSGGGTIVIRGGFGPETHSALMWRVQTDPGTTLINHSYMTYGPRSTGSAVALAVAEGTVLAGSGSFNGSGDERSTDVNGTVSPSAGATNANAGVGTLTFNDLTPLNLNGTYAADVAAGGACDRLAANKLNLGADSRLSVSGTADASSYVVATYTALSGAFNDASNALPAGYDLDYTFGGSNRIALVRQEAPVAPAGLTATTISAEQIDLAWTCSAANESGFRIERAPDEAGSPGVWALLATPAEDATSFSDTGLAPSTTYYYRVAATNAYGDSAWAGPASATTQDPPPAPNAPSGLTATAMSTGRIDLAWTDNASNETRFVVQRAPDEAGNPGVWAQVALRGPNATNYSDTGLPHSTVFHYRVAASNSGGESAWCDAASAKTLSPPAPPAGLAAAAFSPVQINLSWTDNATNEVGFRIERAPDNAGSPGAFAAMATVSSNVTQYLSTGLAPASKYHYRVRSYNGIGHSDYSNIPNATTPAGPANSGFTWTGMADGLWGNANNWLFDGSIPAVCPGSKAGGSEFDVAYFGGRNAGANDPQNTVYVGAANRVSGLVFQDSWSVNNYEALYVSGGGAADGVDVDIPGKDGVARIWSSRGANYKLLLYNNQTWSVATGDTCVIEVIVEPQSVSQNHTFDGGGTMVFKGAGFSSEAGKETRGTAFNVRDNTTLVANSVVALGGTNVGETGRSPALVVEAGSVLAGGGTVRTASGAGPRSVVVNGTLSPSALSSNANTGIGTLAIGQVKELAVNGTYAVDVAPDGSCDAIVAGTLRLGAGSRLAVSGVLRAPRYEIASYTELTGTFSSSASILPPNYKVEYAFEGGNRIVLVRQRSGMSLTVR